MKNHSLNYFNIHKVESWLTWYEFSCSHFLNMNFSDSVFCVIWIEIWYSFLRKWVLDILFSNMYSGLSTYQVSISYENPQTRRLVYSSRHFLSKKWWTQSVSLERLVCWWVVLCLERYLRWNCELQQQCKSNLILQA